MKLNNKGFTVVELLASFILTMIIIVFLFEIVLELRNVYINESIRTVVINKNAVIANSINKMLKDKPITNVNCTKSSCSITIVNFNTGASENKNISVSGRTVTVDNQKIVYPEKTTLENVSLTKTGPLTASVSGDNAIIKVSYDVKSYDLDKPIEFDLIYTYIVSGS